MSLSIVDLELRNRKRFFTAFFNWHNWVCHKERRTGLLLINASRLEAMGVNIHHVSLALRAIRHSISTISAANFGLKMNLAVPNV